MKKRARKKPGAAFRARFPGVIEAAAAEFGFRAEELIVGGKLDTFALCHARAIALWMAHQAGGVSYVELAELIGMTYPSARVRVRAIAQRHDREPKFRAMLKRILAAVPVFAAEGST